MSSDPDPQPNATHLNNALDTVANAFGNTALSLGAAAAVAALGIPFFGPAAGLAAGLGLAAAGLGLLSIATTALNNIIDSALDYLLGEDGYDPAIRMSAMRAAPAAFRVALGCLLWAVHASPCSPDHADAAPHPRSGTSPFYRFSASQPKSGFGKLTNFFLKFRPFGDIRHR